MFCIGFATAALLFDRKDEKGNQIVIKPKYKNYSKKAQKALSQLWQDVKDCGENNPELKKKILEQIESAEWFADLSMGGDYTIPADTYSVKLEPLKVYIGDRVLSLDESYEWFQEAIEEKAAREKLDENGLARCGVCGKSPTYEELNDGFFDLDRVECRGCGVMVTSACGKSKAKWNAMRGYKEADE